jgi:hypothetical protein
MCGAGGSPPAYQDPTCSQSASCSATPVILASSVSDCLHGFQFFNNHRKSKMSIIFSDNFPGDGLIDKSKWKFNVWTPPNGEGSF